MLPVDGPSMGCPEGVSKLAHRLSSHLRRRRVLGLPLGVLGFALMVVVGSLTAPSSASADHAFNNENWDSCAGRNGCIGWKQFAQNTPPVGIAHMDNGGAGCGGTIDVAWANGIIYWNATGTVASFQFPVSNCTPQSYPTVRVVPYYSNLGNANWAEVWTWDQNPSNGEFGPNPCWFSCSRGVGGNAQQGYDLSEVYFNSGIAHTSTVWTWIAKHEIGHVLGLEDHYCGYSGLMDSDACTQINATTTEWNRVNTIHDQ